MILKIVFSYFQIITLKVYGYIVLQIIYKMYYINVIKSISQFKLLNVTVA